MAFDADGIWDIDDLVPKRKKPAKPKYSFDTETVELTFGNDGETRNEKIPQDRLAAARAAMRGAELRYSEKEAERRVEKEIRREADGTRRGTDEISSGAGDAFLPPEPPAFEYSPDNPFIKSVRVLPWPTRFAFRERFCEDARRLFEKSGSSGAEFSDFFSYSPAYSQMTDGQREYYFLWRDGIRGGRYMKTTASYIMLFISETVNLTDLVPPETGIGYLCGIYENYSARFEAVRRELPRWILDYCLINRTSPPAGFALGDTGRSDGEMQLLISGFSGGDDPVVSAIAASSSHSFTESRVITDENRAVFGKYVPAAVKYAIKRSLEAGEHPFSQGDRPWSSVRESERPSYSGLVCAYGSKRVIRTETVTVLRSPELCHAVGDATKYAENRVRAMLGIKNRYHISQLTPALKKHIDDFFAVNSANIERSAPVPEYEKLYDTDERELSPELAAEIENAAWLTTGLLVQDEDGFLPEDAPVPYPEKDAGTGTEGAKKPGEGLYSALAAALEGSAAFNAEAKRQDVFPEALADSVNTAFFDEIGDNIVDAVDGGFEVTFYKDEVRDIITRRGEISDG